MGAKELLSVPVDVGFGQPGLLSVPSQAAWVSLVFVGLSAVVQGQVRANTGIDAALSTCNRQRERLDLAAECQFGLQAERVGCPDSASVLQIQSD